MDFKGQSSFLDAAIDDFVALLRDRISELPFLHHWLGLAVALSSFPASIKLEAGDVKAYPRTDLLAYGRLLVNPNGLLRIPMFGDYAVDTSPNDKPQRRTPSAHLRYSTPASYIISKGHSVKKPYGYQAIYPVADALIAKPEFMGPSYSAGDQFISQLASRARGTGNAATWRWASTDHHLTMNFRALNSFFGIVEPETAKFADPAAAQGFLFADLASPPTAPADMSNELAEPSAKRPGETT
jgi:Beta protein